jgi:hypothetical protein
MNPTTKVKMSLATQSRYGTMPTWQTTETMSTANLNLSRSDGAGKDQGTALAVTGPQYTPAPVLVVDANLTTPAILKSLKGGTGAEQLKSRLTDAWASLGESIYDLGLRG